MIVRPRILGQGHARRLCRMRPVRPVPHGFTLVEVVLALAFIAALSSVAVSWLISVARVSSDAAADAAWTAGIAAVESVMAIDLYADNLHGHDPHGHVLTADRDEPAIKVRGDAVEIKSRDAGPVIVVYRHDAVTQAITRSVRTRAALPRGEPRVLLTGIRAAEFGFSPLHEESGEQATGPAPSPHLFSVDFTDADGQHASLTWIIHQ